MELQSFFDGVYRPLRLRGRSPNTFRLYACTIRAFGKYLGHIPRLEDLEELTLARYLDHRTASGRSPYSAEKERSQLMSMARLANERRMIPSLPTCPSVVLPDRVATAWSEDQLQRLYAAAEATSGFVGVVPAGFFWPTLILAAFETCERIGALLEIRREHYERPNLHIPGELRKGGRRSRVYELSPTLCDRIEAILLREAADHIFEWPHPRTYIWDRLKLILERAGITGRRMAFQQVRRSSISHFAKAGGDPVAFAGHAQAATTKKWYLDPRYADRGPRPSDLLPRIHKAHTDPPPQVFKRAARRSGIRQA